MSEGDDERIVELRRRLTELDEGIVDAVNRRLELVSELKQVKTELGVGFLDPARELWLREHLAETSAGPLSAVGVDELVTSVLELTKREVRDR